jgi:tRNA G18 (ribose-2'-O)-methylase SpoU
VEGFASKEKMGKRTEERQDMHGFFGIGVEGVGNPANVGSLFRSAHAFGAAFVFTVAADYTRRRGRAADTSDSPADLPFYDFPDVAALLLPHGCRLVGIELVEDALLLPSFRHPAQAAYVMGRERGSLTAPMLARCDAVVKIPTKFCLNLGVAGALVMYDRLASRGGFAARPVGFGQPVAAPAPHVRGEPIFRDAERMERYRARPPGQEQGAE